MPTANERPNHQPRRGLRRDDAALYCGLSPSTFDRWVEDGAMPQPIRRGGVVLWDVHRIDRAFEALSDDRDETSPWGAVSLVRS